MSVPKVTALLEGSPAATAGFRVGDELLSLNGEQPRDVIEYQQLVDAAAPRRRGPPPGLAPRHGGSRVDKEAGEPLGLEVSAAVFDRVRTCDNHCAFCFIYQLPKGMRRSLYLKDDDYRLSFLYGNFTTLTRFTELDAERVITERLGPLFVSIHATDPAVRASMLRNPRGATSLRWLRVLLDAGIEVHGQVVVCPGVNDGPVLEDTMLGILDRVPGPRDGGRRAARAEPLLPRARHAAPHDRRGRRRARHRRPHTRTCASDALGRRLVFASDEYYLMAGRPFPAAEAYEGYPQHENGIGMVRAFEAAFEGDAGCRPRGAARLLRLGRRRAAGRLPGPPGHPVDPRARPGRPVAILTGAFGARVLAPLVEGREGVRVLEIENRYFGGTIGVAGLLTGTDVAAVLAVRARRAPLPAPRRVPLEGRVPRRRRASRSCRDPSRWSRPTGSRSGAPSRRCPPVPEPPPERAETERAGRLPIVVVAGRPNVGKSTLVNRIVGRRAAVVDREPGVTRDRKALEAEWNGVAFTLIDTGGWLGRGDELATKVSGQSERAIGDADVVLLVADASVGVTDEDLETARMVAPPRHPGAPRREQGRRRQPRAGRLGAGVPRARRPVAGVGAARARDRRPARRGGATARDAGRGATKTKSATPSTTSGIPRVALVGRPNVGQVDAVQPAGGGGALDRPRPAGHDPRRDRHGDRDARGDASVSSTPPGCAGRRGPTGDRAPFGAPGARRARRRRPRHPRDRRRRSGPPTRTSGWPSGSARPAVRPSWS